MQNIIHPCTVVTLQYRLSDPETNELLDEETRLCYLHSGFNEIFAPVEEILTGKTIGDKIDLIMGPEVTFGLYDKTLIFRESREKLAKQLGIPPREIHVGMVLAFMGVKQKTADAPLATVTKIKDEKITLDANHPLAGKTVRFEAEVLYVRNATTEELAEGRSIDNN